MPGDSFQEWLDGFRKEVDAVVGASAPAAAPGAASAQSAFESWWQANVAPGAEPAPAPLDDTVQRVDRLIQDKAALERKLVNLTEELLSRRGLDAKLADNEVRFSQERESLQLALGKLETQARAQAEQIKSLKENKAFLEESFGRLETAKERLDTDLRLERDRAAKAENELVDAKRRLTELDAASVKLRDALAASRGTLEELRRQAGVYQERLVHAKELTDADVSLLRQELKLFLEEIRICMHTMRKGETK